MIPLTFAIESSCVRIQLARLFMSADQRYTSSKFP